MIKLGDKVKVNKFDLGNYYTVDEVWLTNKSYESIYRYQVYGLCKDKYKNTTVGWYNLWETEVLAKARQYIKELQDPTMTTYICGNC